MSILPQHQIPACRQYRRQRVDYGTQQESTGRFASMGLSGLNTQKVTCLAFGGFDGAESPAFSRDDSTLGPHFACDLKGCSKTITCGL